MEGGEEEEKLLRSVALQTANSVLLLRHRAERELLEAKESLQRRTDELDRSLAMMRATLESTTDAILVTNRERDITGFNEKFLEMWSVPREAMETRRHDKILELTGALFSQREAFLQRVDEIYDTSPPESDDVLELTDGRVIERFSKIQSINGQDAGRVWSFRDITDRRRSDAERERLLLSERSAREQAERETRMKDEFLATLSHELRTPLNAILGWAHILRSTEAAPDVAEGVEVIDRNARAQAQIIEDLLDMSRIISGKVRLEIKPMDLGSVIKSALESVEPMAAAKAIKVSTILGPGPTVISGDSTRLQQVFWNLLTNALKFTPKGGRVEVVLKRADSRIEISVTDTGEGIAADFLPHVFDRFRQADASSTRQHRGLGLGLAIVRNLVESHGGDVRASSAGEKKGATFTVILPVRAATIDGDVDDELTRLAVPPEVLVEKRDLTGLSVLVVDDEADARQLLHRILSGCGATVKTAPSSAIALECLRSNQLHVLVSDIGMPGEDGYALIERVRQLGTEPFAKIPAIALTAFARSEDRESAVSSGFDLHLAKPVDPLELVAAVADLAQRGPKAGTAGQTG